MPQTTNGILPVAEGLTFRPLEATDLERWLELVIRIAEAERTHWHEKRSELAACFADTANPAAANTLAGVDGSGAVRAFGRVSKNLGSDKAYVFGGIDPQWQHRGLGAAMLAWQERQVRARFSAEGQLSPQARCYTDEGNAAPTALLEQAGYFVSRHFAEMLRPLAGAPVAAVPEGLRILTFTQEFAEDVRLAHNEAFADHWGSEPRSVQQWDFLLRNEQFRPEWSAVALDAATGELAGYQVSQYDPERLGKEGREEGYTELLGVRRGWRGRGIARALLADAMERYKAGGMDHACLDVDTESPTGAQGLSERMGYRPLRRTAAWDKKLDPPQA